MISLKKIYESAMNRLDESFKSSNLSTIFKKYQTEKGVLTNYIIDKYFKQPNGNLNLTDISDEYVHIMPSNAATKHKKELIFWISDKEKPNPHVKKGDEVIPAKQVIGISFDGSVLGMGGGGFKHTAKQPIAISDKLTSISKIAELSEKAVVVQVYPVIDYKKFKFKVTNVGYGGGWWFHHMNNAMFDLLKKVQGDKEPEIFNTKQEAIKYAKDMIDKNL